jgi:hypothetical protein
MPRFRVVPFVSLVAACVTATSAALAQTSARTGTVCTITVNSADEKQAFQRGLASDRYRFVELVEKGRPDWLASACRQKVSCDVLIISGHFNGTEFFSEHVTSHEYLPVEEMERASCSESCPALFSNLKEVYLFGCNSLNPEPGMQAAAEVGRTLVRTGVPRADADRVARILAQRHSDSNRDGMRRIFAGVPVIYGFSSTAPVGPVAGGIINRYFQTGHAAEVGRGRTSAAMLSQFSAQAMTAVSGLREGEAGAAYRREVCRFYDERRPVGDTIADVHRLILENPGELRMNLERIEAFVAALDDADRGTASYQRALAALDADALARTRYLDFLRATDEAPVRARLVRLAAALGWFSDDEARSELARLADDLAAAPRIGADAVDLACALNGDDALEGATRAAAADPARETGRAAVQACLGNAGARERVLQALASDRDDDVRAAQVYLQHRPIDDPVELRAMATAIARMTQPEPQIRALNALAGQRLADRDSLEPLIALYPMARSADVQRAIAGIIIRADLSLLDTRALADVLRTYRLRTHAGEDLIDVLLRRLPSA